MNDQINLPRDLGTVPLVMSSMPPIDGSIEAPQTAIDAAQQAYEASYFTGGDELLAALRAATPVVRADEIDAALHRLRGEIASTPAGPSQELLRAGLRIAVGLLETRKRDLGVGL